jgi:hypothetical protein
MLVPQSISSGREPMPKMQHVRRPSCKIRCFAEGKVDADIVASRDQGIVCAWAAS